MTAALLPRFCQTGQASSVDIKKQTAGGGTQCVTRKAQTLAQAHDLDAISDQPVRERPTKPSIHSPRPSSSHRIDQVVSRRPPVGRRIFRALTRFFVAVLIGVGGTLAWQSRSDAVREMVVAQAPTLARLLSVSTAASTVAATSPDPVRQQLAPLASSLDAVRRSVEQLTAKQDQMLQNMAKLQAVDEDIRQTMSSRPSPSRRPPSRSIKPRNPKCCRRPCSRRRRPARRLLRHNPRPRADGADCRRRNLTSLRCRNEVSGRRCQDRLNAGITPAPALPALSGTAESSGPSGTRRCRCPTRRYRARCSWRRCRRSGRRQSVRWPCRGCPPSRCRR